MDFSSIHSATSSLVSLGLSVLAPAVSFVEKHTMESFLVLALFSSFLLLKARPKNALPDIDDPYLAKVGKELFKKKKVEVDFELLAQKLWLDEDPERFFSQPMPAVTTASSTEIPAPLYPDRTVPPAEEDRSAEKDHAEVAEEPRDEDSRDETEYERKIEHLLSKNEKLAEFVKTFVLPFAHNLEREGSFSAVLDVLAMLSEAERISSVAGSETDSSIGFAILKKVSLLEHSLNVAEIGLGLTEKEIPYTLESARGKYLLIFLGHDLGKAFVTEQYATADHPILSARILSEIVPEGYPYREDVIAVIERHHTQQVSYPPKSAFEYDLWLLQQADRAAREKEISVADLSKILKSPAERTPSRSSGDRKEAYEKSKDLENFTDPVGISPEKLLEELLPFVNHSVTEEDLANPDLPLPPNTREGNFLAVSQPDGTVFVRPDLIYEIFLKLIKEKDELVKENAFFLSRPKNEVLAHLVAWLMKNDVIVPGHVKPGYYGRWYTFKIGNSEFKALFTPIRASAFGVLPGKLEEKRQKNPKTAKIHSFKKASS